MSEDPPKAVSLWMLRRTLTSKSISRQRERERERERQRGRERKRLCIHMYHINTYQPTYLPTHLPAGPLNKHIRTYIHTCIRTYVRTCNPQVAKTMTWTCSTQGSMPSCCYWQSCCSSKPKNTFKTFRAAGAHDAKYNMRKCALEKKRELGLGTANLKMPFAIETLCAQNSSKFPEVETGLRGYCLTWFNTKRKSRVLHDYTLQSSKHYIRHMNTHVYT